MREDLCILGNRANPKTPVIFEGRTVIFRWAWDYLRFQTKREAIAAVDRKWRDARRTGTLDEKNSDITHEHGARIAFAVREIVKTAVIECAQGTTPGHLKYRHVLADGNKTKVRRVVFGVDSDGTYRSKANDFAHPTLESQTAYKYAITGFVPEQDIEFLTSGLRAFIDFTDPATRVAQVNEMAEYTTSQNYTLIN